MTKPVWTDRLVEEELGRLTGADSHVPGRLRHRVLEDGLNLQPAAVRPGFSTGLKRLVVGIGGWPSVAAMTVAGVAGLWIGSNPPPQMGEALEYYLTDDVVVLALDVFEPELFAEER